MSSDDMLPEDGTDDGGNGMRGLKLKAGDLVEVRSREEILATLDADACLEDLPFQPEMLEWCGRRMRVWKTAHKTCDTVRKTGGGRMTNAVHLEGARCDGSAHGGCEARCLLFWKEAWLKRVDSVGETPASAPRPSSCTLQTLQDAVTKQRDPQAPDPAWVCQTTSLYDATTPLPWWDFRQYVKDVISGNVSAWQMVRILLNAGYRWVVFLGIGYRALIAAYNAFQKLRGGKPFALASGLLPEGVPTPSGELGLQPGEWVRVKSNDSIRATLNPTGRNRGMRFDIEMVQYCNEVMQVQRRVHRIIDEPTGKMVDMKNPCIVLKDGYCRGHCTPRRLGCPRATDSYWREIWLERVPAPGSTAPTPAPVPTDPAPGGSASHRPGPAPSRPTPGA